MFTEQDVGHYKTDILKKSLLARNSKIEVSAIRKKIAEFGYDGLSSSIDFIVLSADDATSVEFTNTYCVQKKIPYLNIGYLSDISTIGPFYVPNYSACAMCNSAAYGERMDNQDSDLLGSVNAVNARMKAPSTTINNFFSASMAAIDILHYFDGQFESVNSLNKRIGLSNRNFNTMVIEFKKNNSCVICG